MPDCRDCRFLEDDRCSAVSCSSSGGPVSDVRQCVLAIVEDYRTLVGAGLKVLEIGCGTDPAMRDHCRIAGAAWEGVDASAKYRGRASLATRVESVEDLSFPDEHFDLVIGNQTLEHWEESGCRLELGIWQCYRVCKVGGMLLFNFPVRFHGSRRFLEGDIESITKIFRSFSHEIAVEFWGRDKSPLKSVNRQKVVPHRFQGREKGDAFQVDLRVIRRDGIPPRPTGYLVRSRNIRDTLDHRLSYLCWRLYKNLASQALVWASRKGSAPLAGALLKMGADANYENPDGETPLSAAVANGHSGLVGILKEAGAWRIND